jgi:ABC-type enterobactin transport system permease subunit
MLNESDQRLLAEIESSLRADDPRLARRLEQQRRWRLTRHDLVAAVVLVACLALTVGALVNHNVAGTVVALVTVGATVGLWLTHRLNRGKLPNSDAG